MKSILFLLALLPFFSFKHTQRQSTQVDCHVVVNGIDIATKVNGKIVEYEGTEANDNVAITRVTVEDKNGQQKQ